MLNCQMVQTSYLRIWDDHLTKKKFMLKEVMIFEGHVLVKIQVVVHKEKMGWGLFKIHDTPKYPNTGFLLLHDEHYYLVQDMKRVFHERNDCNLC